MLAAYRGSPYHVATIKLLIFTGARLGEVLGLRWEWIDFDRGEARLPDSKTGAKTIHLPAPALEVLAALPRIEGEAHVLGARRGTTFIEAPWRRIREAAGLDDVRLHDLRHAFASVAASAGLALPIIGKMLGHTQLDIETCCRRPWVYQDVSVTDAVPRRHLTAASDRGPPPPMPDGKRSTSATWHR